MKYLYFLCFATCFLICSYAQQFDKVDPNSTNIYPKNKTLINSGLFLKQNRLQQDGCLYNLGEEYPYKPSTPNCWGEIETVTENGLMGEYSKVEILSSGVSYTFSTVPNTAYITITNEEGNTVLASGTGSVSWTSTYVGKIRFIAHNDNTCSVSNNNIAKYVNCGEPIVISNPNFPCFMGDGLKSNNFEEGFRIGNSSDFVADDFTVEEGTAFNLKQIRLNLATEGIPLANTRFIFKEDNAGTPGHTVQEITLIPSFIRKLYDLQQSATLSAYEYTFNLDLPLNFNPGKYWMIPQANSTGGTFSIYWEVTSTGTNGSPTHISVDNGTTWISTDEGFNQVFFVAGECETLNTNENIRKDFSYYPNPINDVLIINSQTDIETVTIFDLTGRKISVKKEIKNGRINTSELSVGTYVVQVQFKGRRNETFKIIKK